MSIAISVRILPSRGLLLASCSMLFIAMVTAAYSVFILPLNIILQFVLLFVLSALMVSRFILLIKRRSAYSLDIAASGRMILRKFPGNGEDAPAMVVRLCRETTLWPHVMMLHLRPEQGIVQIVPVLRDSVDASAWRALSVALRWLAVHERNQKNTSLTMGNF
ncbi:protein YgfX [Undibacterium sp. RuTC16W]|uniref:protein YgfX n=1 Tax=Undibacterium sp. RuTC16W TaxID=3413048 RepID=UPI003BF3699A